MNNNNSFLSNKSHITHYSSPQDEQFHFQESQNFEMLMNLSNQKPKQPKLQPNKNKRILIGRQGHHKTQLNLQKQQPTFPVMRESSNNSFYQNSDDKKQAYRWPYQDQMHQQRTFHSTGQGAQKRIQSAHKQWHDKEELYQKEIELLKKELSYLGKNNNMSVYMSEEDKLSIENKNLRQQVIDNETTYMKYIEEQQRLMKNAQKQEEEVKLREFNLKSQVKELELELSKIKGQLSESDNNKKRVIELENENAQLQSLKQEIQFAKQEKQQNEKYIQEYKQLSEQKGNRVKELMDQNQGQQKQIEILQKENNQYQDQLKEFHSFKSQNQQQEHEKSMLKQEVQNLQNFIEQLKKDQQNTENLKNQQRLEHEKEVQRVKEEHQKQQEEQKENIRKQEEIQKQKKEEQEKQIREYQENIKKQEESQKQKKEEQEKEMEKIRQDLQNTRKNLDQMTETEKKREVEQIQQAKISEQKQNNNIEEEKEAILQLFINLDRFRTTLHQQLQNIIELHSKSNDKNKHITDIEFSLICQKIQMPKNLTQALVRNVYKNSEHDKEIHDIQNILEDNQDIIEIFKQKLFSKILHNIKGLGIQLPDFIKNADQNSDNVISQEDIKAALHSLKIVLNAKDNNFLWKQLDSNGNGNLEVQEVIDSITKYSQMQDLNSQISFDTRMTELYKQQNNFKIKPRSKKQHAKLSAGKPGEQQIQQQQEEIQEEQVKKSGGNEFLVERTLEVVQKRVDVSFDKTFVHGQLYIKLPYIKNLVFKEKPKQLTVVVQMLGELPVKRTFLYLSPDNIDQQIIFNITGQLKENLSDILQVQIYDQDKDFCEDNYLGETQIYWKKCMENSEQWLISHEFPIQNYTYNRETEPKNCGGQIGIQCLWQSELPENQEKKKQEKFFKGTVVEDGILEVKVVRGLLKEPKKRVKCEVTMPDDLVKGEIMLAKLDAQKQPYWGKKLTQTIRKAKNEKFNNIQVRVFWETETAHLDNELGNVYIDWHDCSKKPYVFHNKQAFLFGKDENQEDNKIYVLYRWLPMQFAERYEKQELTEGVLKVLVVRAKNLRADDGASSDPYTILKFQNYKEELEQKTAWKGKTLNPQWNEIIPFNIQFEKFGPVPPLEIEVMDHDKLSDDSLGTVSIDVTQCLDNPCKWAVDDYFELDEGEYAAEKSQKAQIYIQTYFVPKNEKDPNIKPQDKENLTKKKADDKVVQGKLKVKIVHARDLKAADNNASDPYAIVLFPDQTEKTTNTISKTLNPIWNEMFEQEISVYKEKLEQKKAPIKIILKDSDYMAKDDLLGHCDIDWYDCVKRPGEWMVNQVYEIQGEPDIKKNLKTLGYIYVQVQFIEPGMIDDHLEAPMVENLAQKIADEQGAYKGNLRVYLVSAKNLVKADDGEKDFSDPYVIFKAPGAKKIESSTIDNTLNPVWKTVYNVPLNMPKDQIQPMRVEVLDQDLLGNDLLGYVNIDLEEALKNPSKWGLNKIYELDGGTKMRKKYNTEKFGEIYMQIMYVPVGAKNDDPPLHLLEDQEAENLKQAIDQKSPMKGVIECHIITARNLKIADTISKTSDPYVTIEFPDESTISTKTIKKNLNPIWNFENRHSINILKRDYKPLKFIVKDSDVGAIDDTLGNITVEWMECFENPAIWKINQVFKLEGESKYGADLGDIYIQIRFLRSGDLEQNFQQDQQQEELEQAQQMNRYPVTIPDLLQDYGRIIGVVKLDIKSAINLTNKDTFGKSDPFAVAYLTTKPGNKIKTMAVKDSLDPEWNFTGQFYVNLLRCQANNVKLVTEIYDEDNLRPEFIGQVSIDLLDILEKKDKYVENVYNLFDPSQKESKANLGSVKLGYQWVKDKDCESLDGLRDPPPMATGDLIVNIMSCRELKDQELIGKSDPFVQFQLNHIPDKKYKTKTIDNNLNPDFDHAEKIALDMPLKLAKTLKLKVKVKDDGTTRDSMLGGVTVDISKQIEKPGSWFNNFLKLRDEDGQAKPGYIYIQSQFRSIQDKDSIQASHAPKLAFKEFLERGLPKQYPGTLHFSIIGARNLQSNRTDKIDPFVEAKLSNGFKQVIKTDRIDDSESPCWYQTAEIPLNLNEEEWEYLKVIYKLYDYDFMSNDLKGIYERNLESLYKAPGEWINEIVPLLTENECPGGGELYIQLCWQPEGSQKPQQPPDLFAKEKQEHEKKIEEAKKNAEEEEKNRINGKLFLKVVESSGLKSVDAFGGKSDGFAELKFNFGTKQTYKTKTIEDNSDPVWDESFVFDISVKQSDPKTNLLCTVYDYDYNGNDYLGHVEIPFDLSQVGGKWINQIYHLLDTKGQPGKNGLISLQMQFRENGKNVDTNVPQPQDMQAFKLQNAPVGRFYVKVVKASGILGVEKKGQFSDAYAKLTFGKKDRKTKVIKSVNPEWNQVHKFKVDYKDVSLLPPLICEVWDDNTFGDDFLGEFETSILGDALKDPLKYSIIQKFPLANINKKKTKGEITGEVYLEIGFAPKDKKRKKKEDYQIFQYK